MDDAALEGMDASGGGASTPLVPGSTHGSSTPGEVTIKFECQMYKVRDDEYMIDVQVRQYSAVHICSTVVFARPTVCSTSQSSVMINVQVHRTVNLCRTSHRA